jgi:dTDP-4-amino-4,6-dideoxygalactose transaminase
MIKLMKPYMPTTEALIPYLKRIETAGWYSNEGPLVTSLERRCAGFVGMPCHAVANATLGLQIALQALGIQHGHTVLVPAMTFAASGLAISRAGFSASYTDIDKDSWQLEPYIVEELISRGFKPDAVMPVATFGAPVSDEWRKFAEKHPDIQVVIDAAGAFTEMGQNFSPLLHFVYSLHATKFVGCGEGGLIASRDHIVMGRARNLSSFVGDQATNAKMSEYHAAVAHASLDMLNAKRLASINVARQYAAWLPKSVRTPYVRDRVMLPILLPEGTNAAEVKAKMLADEIETKQWYRPFLDERAGMRTDLFPVTDMLRQRMLGIPYHYALTPAEIEQVCASLERAIHG